MTRTSTAQATATSSSQEYRYPKMNASGTRSARDQPRGVTTADARAHNPETSPRIPVVARTTTMSTSAKNPVRLPTIFVRALVSPSVEVSYRASKRTERVVAPETALVAPLAVLTVDREESVLLLTPLACRWAAGSRSAPG